MLIQSTDISTAIHECISLSLHLYDCISVASSTSCSLVVPLSPMVRPRSIESYSIESKVRSRANLVELIITWYYGNSPMYLFHWYLHVFGGLHYQQYWWMPRDFSIWIIHCTWYQGLIAALVSVQGGHIHCYILNFCGAFCVMAFYCYMVSTICYIF